ncbi:MAG: DNA-binding transcriptional MerR regulator [Cyclobacteriaceae bacterium]|jgi:DNA-binding transcriptional MerR regulator
MSRFSIKDLEQLTGIKAHTLRIWEQRYGIIKTHRTQTNIRYYDDEALKLSLNVALLNAHGFKISKIAQMLEEEIQNTVLQITEDVSSFSDQIHALTLSMIDLNEQRFEKIIASNTLKYGFEATMLHIIYPFLSKIGILWLTGSVNPAQEHFITNLIRQKLIVAIDGIYEQVPDSAPKFLLFLPEGELHEISLLFSDLIIRSRKNKSIYLGQSLPIDELTSVYEYYKPDYILTILTSVPGSSNIQNYVNTLSSQFPDSTILISGMQVIGQDLNTPANVKILVRPDQLIEISELETTT